MHQRRADPDHAHIEWRRLRTRREIDEFLATIPEPERRIAASALADTRSPVRLVAQ